VSRSNPAENGLPNPSTRWFQWSGEAGVIRYYDKEKEETIDVGSDFTFMLLDQLASVRGWHDPSESGIYSNEVKDTRKDVLVVKSFKGGPIAEGLYKDIKDRVNNEGGRFVASCYVAFKDGDGLSIGNIGFKGAALREWMEFTKAHRSELLKKAVKIDGFTEDKKGRVVFRTPNFRIVDVSPETDKAATALDRELQEFLSHYLKKNTLKQAESMAHVSDEELASGTGEFPEPVPQITDDDIPF
jgi:hypothetical protein